LLTDYRSHDRLVQRRALPPNLEPDQVDLACAGKSSTEQQAAQALRLREGSDNPILESRLMLDFARITDRLRVDARRDETLERETARAARSEVELKLDPPGDSRG
jgi:hypothetical protein